MRVTSADAEKVVDDVLSGNEEMLAVSIMDMGGNPLAAKSNYGATLALATLSLVNQVRNVFGEAQAIITIHKNCKLMLLSMPSYPILVGLVLERSVNAEDHNIVDNIERLMADVLNRNGSL